MRSPSKWPLSKAWLVVATLDILAAIVQTLAGGGNLSRLGQYIASGVFGRSAFEGGVTYALMGYVFHYGIAFGWTALFYVVYPRVNLLHRNWVITGVGYGMFVWFMMNRVILPLSNVPQGPFDLARATLACTILIVAIGLPLAWMSSRGRNRD
ncbi:MAG: hypothetical protein JNN04_14480 [Cyclobacteriaceae bacterium]|nr:hypothetical protein [Cyclobacteriaceae bacterium]